MGILKGVVDTLLEAAASRGNDVSRNPRCSDEDKQFCKDFSNTMNSIKDKFDDYCDNRDDTY